MSDTITITGLNPKPTPVASTDLFAIDDLNAVTWHVPMSDVQTYVNANSILTQSQITGLHVADSPTFAGLTLSSLSSLNGLLYVSGGVVARINNIVDKILTYNGAGIPLPQEPGYALYLLDGILSVNFNTTNLRINTTQLDTIQGIATTSSPVFTSLTATGSVAGTTYFLNTTNTDNTSGTSNAANKLTVGGTSGGDPYNSYIIGTAHSWASGIDNSDSQKFKIRYSTDANASPSSGSTYLTISTLGIVSVTSIVASDGMTISAFGAGSIVSVTTSGVLTEIQSAATGNSLLSGGVGSQAAWGKVGLTTHVTGILGSANGGTANGFTKFSGATTSEKTYTLPNASDTIACLGQVNAFTAQQYFTQASLTDASPITWNLQTQQVASVLLTSGVGATRQLQNPTNMVAGGMYFLKVIQSSTGSNALTYGSNYKWPGGTAPVLSIANNAIDILSFYSDGTNLYGVANYSFS